MAVIILGQTLNRMEIQKENLRPNKAELQFLSLAVTRFFNLFGIVMSDEFWTKDPKTRLLVLKDGFAIYTELLNYEPIKWEIEKIRTNRAPMEAEIVTDFFKFIRNVISHFPLYDTWDDIFLTKEMINWNKQGLTIDKYMEKYQARPTIKYRFWEPDKKRMTYLDINFPSDYVTDKKYFLKDLLKEQDGVKFAYGLMRNVISTQIVIE